jgi:hypothetical protein
LKLGRAIIAMLLQGLAGTAPAQHLPFVEHYRTEYSKLTEARSIAGNCLVPIEPDNRRPVPPPRLTIGKTTYFIELVKEVPASGEFARFSGRTCDKEAQKLRVCEVKDRIYIEKGHPLKEEQTTLLHELQHAILGTEKSDRNTTYHQFIYQLSPKLLQVLKQNPDLYSYLTASESQ